MGRPVGLARAGITVAFTKLRYTSGSATGGRRTCPRPPQRQSPACAPSPFPASRRFRWRSRCRSPAAVPRCCWWDFPIRRWARRGNACVRDERHGPRAAATPGADQSGSRGSAERGQPLRPAYHARCAGRHGGPPAQDLYGYAALGELSLDGTLNPVDGGMPAAIGASTMDLGLICPAGQGGEAAWAGRIEVLAATDLLSLINHFRGTQVLTPPEPPASRKRPASPICATSRGWRARSGRWR